MEKEYNDKMIYKKENNVEYLQFKILLEYSDIINHAFGIKENGYRTMRSVCEYGLKSYNNLCNAIGEDYNNLVKPIQVHGDIITEVKKKLKINSPDVNLLYYAESDGLVTNKKNLILGTTNADCILLMFFDPVKKVIANVHSGWRGTFKKIAQKTIEKMIKIYSCRPEDIICTMCPSIRKCHFEVQEDVKDLCYETFGYTNKMDRIIEEKFPGESWKIDLIEINRILLMDMGLKEKNIVDSGICSVCNSDIIHSYRADKEKFNLNTAIIKLK